MLSGSWDTTLKAWDVRNGICLDTFRSHFAKVMASSLHKDMLASADQAGKVHIRNLAKIFERKSNKNNWLPNRTISSTKRERPACSISLRSSRPMCVALQDDMVVSGGMDCLVTGHDSRTGQALGREFYGHDGYISSALLNLQDDILISGSGDHTIRVWIVSRNSSTVLKTV